MSNSDNPYNRCDIGPGKYVVLVRGGKPMGGRKAKYILATSSAFNTKEDAIRYRDSIDSSWEPCIAQVTL